jgi:MFS family permease
MDSRELAVRIDEIALGPYQLLYLIVGGWLTFGEGVELAVGSTLNLSFFKEFQVHDPVARALLAASVFMGIGLGMFCSGLAGDRLGRRPVLLLSFAGMSLTMAAIPLSLGVTSLFCMRLANGFACGLGVIAAATAMAEVCPTHARAWLMGLIPCGLATGCLVGALILWALMPHLQPNGRWREVCWWAAVPAGGQFLAALVLLDETPHFCCSQRDNARLVKVLSRMARLNGKPELALELLASGSDKLEESGSLHDLDKSPARSQLASLCGKRRITVTLTMFCVLEFFCSFLNAGIGYMLPRLAAHLGGPLEGIHPAAKLLFIASLVDYPSIMVLVILMASAAGHRQVIGSFSTILGICFLTLAYAGLEGLVALMAVMLLKLSAFPALAPYHIWKNESIPTLYRMTACGICSLFGKGGAILSPFLFELLTRGEEALQEPHIADGQEHHGPHHGNSPGGHSGRHARNIHEHHSGEQGSGLMAQAANFLTSVELAGSGPTVAATSLEVPSRFLMLAGLFSFAVVITVLFLRETKGRPLPTESVIEEEFQIWVSSATAGSEQLMRQDISRRRGYGSLAFWRSC